MKNLFLRPDARRRVQRASVWGFNPNHVISVFCGDMATYDNKAIRDIVAVVKKIEATFCCFIVFV